MLRSPKSLLCRLFIAQYPVLDEAVYHHDIDRYKDEKIRPPACEISVEGQSKGQSEKYSICLPLQSLYLSQKHDKGYYHIDRYISVAVRHIESHGSCCIYCRLPFFFCLKKSHYAKKKIKILDHHKILYEIRRSFVLSKNP